MKKVRWNDGWTLPVALKEDNDHLGFLETLPPLLLIVSNLLYLPPSLPYQQPKSEKIISGTEYHEIYLRTLNWFLEK